MNMTPAARHLALASTLLPALAGLAASSILMVEYAQPTPVFCDLGGGCEAIKHTTQAAWLGIPTPFIGVSGFLVMAGLSLAQGKVARIAQLALAVLGAAFAVMLIVV